MRQKDAEIVLYQSLVNFEVTELDQTLVILKLLTNDYSSGDSLQIPLIEFWVSMLAALNRIWSAAL